MIRRISEAKREDAPSDESDVFDSGLLRKAQVTKAALFPPEMRGFGLLKEQDASLAYQPWPDSGPAHCTESEGFAWGIHLHCLEYEGKEGVEFSPCVRANLATKAPWSVLRREIRGPELPLNHSSTV